MSRMFAGLGLTVLFAAAPGSGAGPSAPSKPSSTAGANVHAVNGPGLKRALTALQGKVVVLNIWATTCGPCVEEFPGFVRLHNAYKAKGLTVLAVSMDEPEDRQRVVEFIAERKAAFPVYLRSNGGVDDFFDPINKKWDGAMPTTYLYDRGGGLKRDLGPGALTYAELEAAVTPLLK